MKYPIFIDLEPYLGSMDFIFNDLTQEIVNYPHNLENGFFDTNSTNTNFNELLQPENFKKIWDTDFKDLAVKEWTGEYPYSEKRITLVKNTERRGIFFAGKPWEKSEPHFQKTWGHIKKLPIEIFYRTVLIIGSPNNEIPPHVDWGYGNSPVNTLQAHTLFINPKNNRSFYYMNDDRKAYTNSSIFLFDQRVTHGITADKTPGVLLRIFCKLEDDFCDIINYYKALPPKSVVKYHD